jgi:hypothetical protein
MKELDQINIENNNLQLNVLEKKILVDEQFSP